MIRRFLLWLLAFGLVIDRLGYVLGTFIPYVFFNFGGAPPSPDETISAFTGCYAIRGRWWALAGERVINALFWFTPDHCRRAVKGDQLRAEALVASERALTDEI